MKIEKLNKFSLTNTEKFDVMGGKAPGCWTVCKEATNIGGVSDTTTTVVTDEGTAVPELGSTVRNQ